MLCGFDLGPRKAVRMDRCITSVDLDDVMDEQEFDGMGRIDLDISMLAQD